MSCTLGRATLPSPDKISQDGAGVLTIGHTGYAFTGTDGLVMARQVLGYPNPDEEIVPFTYDATSAGGILDGFYFVESTSVDWVKLAAGLFAWTARLVPVGDLLHPVATFTSLGTDRPNSHSVSNQRSWIGFPVADGLQFADTALVVSEVTAETGTVRHLYDSSDYWYDGKVDVVLTVDNAYDGACRILEGARVASNTAPDFTGHDVVTGRTITADPDAVMIDNGLMRVCYGTTSGLLLVGQYQHGTGWKYKTWYVGVGSVAGTYGPIADPTSVTVLVNSPQCVAVRFRANTSVGNVTTTQIDVTLRRGQTWADFHVQSLWEDPTVGVVTYNVYRATNEASTATGVTGGINANADDADLNKFMVRSPDTTTKNHTIGGMSLTTAALTFDFAISTDYWSTVTVDNAYWALVEPHQEFSRQ